MRRWLLLLMLALVGARPAVPGEQDEPTSNGPVLFTEHRCATCHSIGSISTGVGPELTQVGWRRSREWLMDFMRNPGQFLMEPGMPAAPLDTMEALGLAEYLLSVRKPIPAAHARDGAKLFDDYQCGSCHAVGGKGGKDEFPDLAGVGSRRSPAELSQWLFDPQALKEGTFMPSFKLKPSELKALVKYLYSLK